MQVLMSDRICETVKIVTAKVQIVVQIGSSDVKVEVQDSAGKRISYNHLDLTRTTWDEVA